MEYLRIVKGVNVVDLAFYINLGCIRIRRLLDLKPDIRIYGDDLNTLFSRIKLDFL